MLSEGHLLLLGLLLTALACVPPERGDGGSEGDRAEERARMVEEQLRQGVRPITDPVVLEAMAAVPRHRFVPPAYQAQAYDDGPLPIGHGQTISQPYIVALMTELVRPRPGMRALDVGTGSGYQAAVLAECGAEVFSIEIIPELGEEAADRLRELGYEQVTPRIGDGWAGWPEEAPFDAIVVAAAPADVPPALVEQLAPGGRLVLPLGDVYQDLILVEKDESGEVSQRNIAPVRFVPMTGGEDHP